VSGISLRTTRAKVVSVLGAPDKIDKILDDNVTLLSYGSNSFRACEGGVRVTIGPSGKVLRVESRQHLNWGEHESVVGESREAVEQIFSPHFATWNHQSFVRYSDRTASRHLDFKNGGLRKVTLESELR